MYVYHKSPKMQYLRYVNCQYIKTFKYSFMNKLYTIIFHFYFCIDILHSFISLNKMNEFIYYAWRCVMKFESDYFRCEHTSKYTNIYVIIANPKFLIETKINFRVRYKMRIMYSNKIMKMQMTWMWITFCKRINISEKNIFAFSVIFYCTNALLMDYLFSIYCYIIFTRLLYC